MPNAEPKSLRRVGATAILVRWMKRLPKLFAQTVAAVAIALFWCVSAVGTTVTTTLGVTTLATAVNAVTATPAEARRRHRGRGRGRGRRRRGRGRHRRGRGVCVGVGGVWVCG